MKTTPTYKIVQAYKATDFNVYSIERYRLCIVVGKMYFSVVALESSTAKCVLWEHYEIFNAETLAEANEAIKPLVEQHFCLNAGFWNQISVAISSDQFCMIPSAYFDETAQADFLRLNSYFYADLQEVRSTWLTSPDLHCVFGIDTTILDFWQKIYPQKNIRFSHQAAAFLLSILQAPIAPAEQLHLLLQDGMFYAVAFQKSKLILANTFRFGTVQDFLYYVLLLVEQLGMDARQANLYLCGNITKKSDLYANLSSYLDHIQFHTKINTLSWGSESESLPLQLAYGTLGLYF